MKRLISLLLLVAPGFALAQQPGSTTPKTVGFQAALQDPINPLGFTLDKKAALYRRLADTLKTKPALRLRPGDNVIISQRLPHWFKVVRGNADATSFSKDTASYYLPASATRGAQMFILL